MDVDFFLEDFPCLKYIADNFVRVSKIGAEGWKNDGKIKWEESSS